MRLNFFFLAIACLVFTACQKEDGPAPMADRTVLVYMAADNNLGWFATQDVEEMKQGIKQIKNSNIHLLVYIDTPSSLPRLIEIREKDGKVTEETVKTYNDRNSVGMAETQEVFADVFSNTKFQAKSYGLVYWSHADGWIPSFVPNTRWVGQDTGGNTYHYMDIPQLVDVLENAPHFDFIMFDACFMLSVEVAYELRNFTDYYIGSPTENPGPGAPYDLIVPLMFEENAAIRMASAYFKAYNDIYNGGQGISNDNWTGGTSIGVIQTSGLKEMATVTRQVLSNVAEPDKDRLRKEVFDYDHHDIYRDYVGYFDMKELMSTLLEDNPAAYDQWLQAFKAALPFWATTPQNYSQFVGMFSMERANGITHYIPSSYDAPTATAYRSTSWYNAAGLARLGW